MSSRPPGVSKAVSTAAFDETVQRMRPLIEGLPRPAGQSRPLPLSPLLSSPDRIRAAQWVRRLCIGTSDPLSLRYDIAQALQQSLLSGEPALISPTFNHQGELTSPFDASPPTGSLSSLPSSSLHAKLSPSLGDVPAWLNTEPGRPLSHTAGQLRTDLDRWLAQSTSSRLLVVCSYI
jgi:hypothetical protein